MRNVPALAICFYFLIVVPHSLVNAQESKKEQLTGFLDIKWNESYASAKKKLLKRKDARLDIENTDNEQIVVRNIEIGGQMAAYVQLGFADKRFISAIVRFSEVPEHKLLNQYKEIKELISLKYGEPDTDSFQFKDPYSAADGYETQAIRLGKSLIASVWKFPTKVGEGHVLVLTVKDVLAVEAAYIFLDAANTIIQEDKDKKSQEF